MSRRCLPRFSKMLACRRGSVAIEFAFVMPVFLIVLFGIISFGSYIAMVHSIQQLAAEATRAAVAGLSDSERASLAANSVNASVGAYPLIAPERLAMTSAVTDPASSTFSVTLRYDASDMFIFNLPSFVPAPSPTIVRSASIQRGGY